MYERDAASGRFAWRALHVLELDGGLVAALTAFQTPALASALGLPAELP